MIIRFIFTAAIAFFMIRFLWRLMYPTRPDLPLPQELRECGRCHVLKPTRDGVFKNDHFFCCKDHAESANSHI